MKRPDIGNRTPDPGYRTPVTDTESVTVAVAVLIWTRGSDLLDWSDPVKGKGPPWFSDDRPGLAKTV